MQESEDESAKLVSNETDGTNQNSSDIQSKIEELQSQKRLAITTNQKYKTHIETLQKKIEVLNQQSELSIKFLEDKKIQLHKEHERLQSILNSLPTSEHLEEQYSLLQSILKDDTSSPPSLHSQLKNLGLLYSGETIEVIPQRLQLFVNRLNSFLDMNNSDTNFQDEEIELQKQIQILQKSESTTQIKVECGQIRQEIEQLKEEIQSMKEKSLQQHLITEEDIYQVVIKSGGDPKKIRKIRGKLYKYGSTLFTIEIRFNQIFAKTKETEMLLSVLIQTLINRKGVPVNHHSIL